MQWSRVPNNASFTIAVAGVPYLVFVVIALLVLYFTRLRGNTDNITAPMRDRNLNRVVEG